MNTSEKMKNIKPGVKRVDNPPYVLVDEVKRYNPRNNLFNRKYWDKTVQEHQRDSGEKFLSKVHAEDGRIHLAAWSGAWYVAHLNNCSESNDGARGDDTGLYNWKGWDNGLKEELEENGGIKFPYKPENLSEFSRKIKELAVYFGASAAGICRLNRSWIFSHNYYCATDTTTPLKIDESVQYAVVMLFEMQGDVLETTPEFPASIETGFAYSRMAFTAATMGQFIRSFGYTAVPAGNDTALSIPLAVDAGLGQLGRNGLLVTPQYGSRVRIAKVLTDMPLEPDRPIDFGLTEICNNCKKCARACEVEAISFEKMTPEGPSFSNNPGAMKWYLNAEKCYRYWSENGLDCSTCITSCPFSSKNPDLTEFREQK